MVTRFFSFACVNTYTISTNIKGLLEGTKGDRKIWKWGSCPEGFTFYINIDMHVCVQEKNAWVGVGRKRK